MKKYRISLVDVHYVSDKTQLYHFVVYKKVLFFWIPVFRTEGNDRDTEYDKCMNYIESKAGELIIIA